MKRQRVKPFKEEAFMNRFILRVFSLRQVYIEYNKLVNQPKHISNPYEAVGRLLFSQVPLQNNGRKEDGRINNVTFDQ